MQYIYYGDAPLHILYEEYYVGSPKLTEELNKVAQLEFTIYPTHPLYNELEDLVPSFEVRKGQNNKTTFRGRKISEKINMDKSKTVTVESNLAFLIDTLQFPYNFQGTPEDLFMYYLNVHNSQVGTFTKTADTTPQANKVYFILDGSLYKQVTAPDASQIANYYEVSGAKVLYAGKMTGANLDNNDYINRSNSKHSNTFEEIEKKLIETIGGYFFIRYESNGNFIDWVDDFTEEINGETGKKVSGQVIEFGENLIDIAIDNDATEVYTVIFPYGAKIEESEGENEGGGTEEPDTPEIFAETENYEPENRVTIKDVNEGKEYIVNEEGLAKYGWIVAPVDETTWDDVTVPLNLKNKAIKYLNNSAVMLKSTIELNAIDLNMVDASVDDFVMGEYIRVQSTPHGISKDYLLTKKETPLDAPENMKITLGETIKTLTGIQIDGDKNNITIIEGILSDYVLNEDVSDIVNKGIQNNSIIQQIPDSIMQQVSGIYTEKKEFEEYKEQISTTLTQTTQGWEQNWQTIIEEINRVDGEIDTTYNEIIKYIRYVDGTIEIGIVGNETTLHLSNDRLSIMENNVEVAYFSNQKMYITDGEFLNSLVLGNFAFIPRKNGNLSFKKVR